MHPDAVMGANFRTVHNNKQDGPSIPLKNFKIGLVIP